MKYINTYNNLTSYLLDCVPLEYKDNFDKAVNLLESVIEVAEYKDYKYYIDIFELDIRFFDLIDRLYDRAICIEREDLITMFFHIKSEHINLETQNNRPIEVAVNNGATKSLALLIKLGYHEDVLYGCGCQANYTALEVACKCGNKNMVKYLLKMGVSPNIASIKDNSASPLFYSLLNGDFYIAKMLIEYGANLYYIDETGNMLQSYIGKSGSIKTNIECICRETDRLMFEEINDFAGDENAFLDLAVKIDNKKLANVRGSVFDIALEGYGISLALKLFECGFRSSYNTIDSLSHIINRYNAIDIEIKEFGLLENIIYTILKESNEKFQCSGSSVMFEYCLVKVGKNDEDNYTKLFEVLKARFLLDYQRQMNDYALLRLAFRVKNLSLIEYFVKNNIVPVEFDDSQNVFHDMAIFNQKVSEYELKRLCDFIGILKRKGVDPYLKSKNGVDAVEKASFICEPYVREKILSAFTEKN